jgi:mxaJ protein
MANTIGRRKGIGSLVSVLFFSILLSGPAGGAEMKGLRICGDPDNLPYSNERQEGFENKIAELLAKDLGATLTYFWWPHQRGVVRNTLQADNCDVLIGIPKGYDLVLWTKPYYRTGYVIAYPKCRGYQVASLDDPVLKRLRIGVHFNTPPFEALGERGIRENLVEYSLFFDYRVADATQRPAKVMEDLYQGAIDVAVVWGPMAGYAAKQHTASPLELVPLQDSGRIPMTFEISMGVKKGNRDLKALLEGALDRRQAEIRQILEGYGVPLLASTTPPPAAGGAPGENQSSSVRGGHPQ